MRTGWCEGATVLIWEEDGRRGEGVLGRGCAELIPSRISCLVLISTVHVRQTADVNSTIPHNRCNEHNIPQQMQ